MPTDPITTGILGSILLWRSGGWLATKTADMAVQTITDGNIKSQLADARKSVAARLRGRAASEGWFGDRPKATATNHDLLRALRAAWVTIAQQKLRPIRELQESFLLSAEFRDWPELSLLVDTLGDELEQLSVVATHRTKQFVESSPVEERLLEIVSAAPEQTRGEIDATFSQDLTEAFVTGIMALPVEWEGPLGGVRNHVTDILRAPLTIPRDGRKVEPGAAILDQFIENLKSGLFPEASKAFEILVGGLIRGDVEDLRELVDDRTSEIAQDLQNLRSVLSSGMSEPAREAFEKFLHDEHDEIVAGIGRIERELGQLKALLGSREYDFKSTADNSILRREELAGKFFGRQRETEAIFDRFHSSPNTLSIVVAPAGTGKSAFMAHLADRAEVRGYAVASHFVTRKREGTREARQVLGHLAVQIRAIHSPVEEYGRSEQNAGGSTDEIQSLLSQGRPYRRPLVILVDGLDEMPERLPVFVPSIGLGTNIHIVISCRTGGMYDAPSALVAWSSQETAKIFGVTDQSNLRMPLPPMDRPSIALWLCKSLEKVSLIDALPLVERLEATSEGLAVFLDLLIMDIVTRLHSGRTIAELETWLGSLPAPFESYLRAELEEKPGDRKPPYGPDEREFLALVSVALGPIWDDDLNSILPRHIDRRNPPPSVRRWLSRISEEEGKGGYGWIVQHPRLVQPLVAALDIDAEDAHEALLEHCRSLIDKRDHRRARYAAMWGARHFIKADIGYHVNTAKNWLSDPSFLEWRLEIDPSRQMIRAINDDYFVLERHDPDGSNQHQELARVFATISPMLAKEAAE
ncbi:ATP-binding protein [Epibacterium sp. DP7N7-1]|nr:ATP-binding protein [Epibacterium sp. DP7N7-1]